MLILFVITPIHNLIILQLNSTTINYVKQYCKTYYVIIVNTFFNIISVSNSVCIYYEYIFFGNIYKVYHHYSYDILIVYVISIIINIHIIIYISIFINYMFYTSYYNTIFITIIRLCCIHSCNNNMSVKEYYLELKLRLQTQKRLPIFFWFKPLPIFKWYMEIILNVCRYILHLLKCAHNNIYLELLLARVTAIIIKLYSSYNYYFIMPLVNLNTKIYVKVNRVVLMIAMLLDFTYQLLLIFECFTLIYSDY